MLDIIKFFSRYNKNMVIDFEILQEYNSYGKEKVKQIIEVLQEIEKHYDIKDIYFYYFREFYIVKKENCYSEYFDVTRFIDEMCVEYDRSELLKLRIDKQALYKEITHYLY